MIDQMYNYIQIFGSLAQIVLLGVSTGVAYKIGTATTAQLDLGYRVLLGMFGAVTVVTTIPYLIIMKHRPGQQLPRNTSWFMVGPKCVMKTAFLAPYDPAHIPVQASVRSRQIRLEPQADLALSSGLFHSARR